MINFCVFTNLYFQLDGMPREGIEGDEAIPAAEVGGDDGTWMSIKIQIKRAKLQYYTMKVSQDKRRNSRDEYV
jgi:hypothetical protein